jgi:hypothetical protein
MQVQGVVVVALVLAACSGKASTGDETNSGGGSSNDDAGGASTAGKHTSATGGSSGSEGGDDGGASAGDTFQPAPPARGAMTFTVKPPSPLPPGKACPTSAGFTSELPAGNGPTASNYPAHVVDGEDGAAVSCRVAGDSTFEISGKVQLAGRALLIEDGVVSADEPGSASITVVDSERLATGLRGTTCVLSVEADAPSNLQIKPGSVWASFSCPSVESAPSDYCQASGFFVLENCDQE